jgi:hypothetical protein
MPPPQITPPHAVLGPGEIWEGGGGSGRCHSDIEDVILSESKDEDHSPWRAFLSSNPQLVEEKERQDSLRDRIQRFFEICSDKIYVDKIDQFYLAEGRDGGVYLLTGDLNYAKLIAEDADVAAEILKKDTLEDAAGPWRFYGMAYDRFGEEERPDLEDFDPGEDQIVLIENDDFEDSDLGFFFSRRLARGVLDLV